jgi:hypothetical protein
MRRSAARDFAVNDGVVRQIGQCFVNQWELFAERCNISRR